ncbi:unnamed protein product [Adineta steineri]|uniref:EF-hand domain-containing protein n=1 Tax=Adineta steineri TaxID=433720 RepID=A0A814S3I9_9BILA|nr:unnamed protein product [Adineta steineri]CAF0857997.1 unnamed protein product [Adineta steineri]CAF1142767.1 unnamed protein product [Adineta steineri]
MAELVSLDSINRSESSASLQSNATVNSRHSSICSLYSTVSTRRRYGFLNKMGNGFQSVFRRITKTHKTLSDKEIQILSTVTNFDREQILQWHQKFLGDCPNGYMTRKQFVSMYKTLCPNANAERFARHIFRAFDLDRSNTVDFREFLIGLSITSSSSSIQTKLEWLFQVFDIDGNGLLTRMECLEVIDAIVRFNHQPMVEDNFNIEQLVLSAKRSMMKIFDNISERNCNSLTMAEFVEGCYQDKLISQLLAPNQENGQSSTSTQNTHDMSIITE